MGPGVSAKSRGTGGHGSTPDAVREALRLAIGLGEFAPGFQLRQDELAERFGTSRIPVREALKQLEAEGFVTFMPNRGAVVSDLSIDEVVELLEIRIALECYALIEANYGHVSRFTSALVSRATGKERPQREHYQLLELCRDGEIEKAVRLLREHIVQTEKMLRSAQRHASRDASPKS